MLRSLDLKKTNERMAWARMLWTFNSIQDEFLVVWACMLGKRLRSEHGCCYGMGTGALVVALTKQRTLSWFGHACPGKRTHSEHGCYYGMGMGALVVALSKRRTSSWFGHACSSKRTHSERGRYYGLLWSWNSINDERYFGLGMVALVMELNKRRTLLWFRHACSSKRMPSRHERYDGLDMDAPGMEFIKRRMLLWFGQHALVIELLQLNDEREYGLGMDALATVCIKHTRQTACSRHG